MSSETVTVADSTNLSLDFIVLMEPIPYKDSTGKQKYADITKPIRSPNRTGSFVNQFSGVYFALQEKGNLKSSLKISRKAEAADINAIINDSIGPSKFVNDMNAFT